MKRKQKLTAVLTVFFLGLLAASAFVITKEHDRLNSPDYRFYAVSTCPIWQYCIPMSPGGGSDKSGYVTVYTREGKSCGRAPVGMVWMMKDMEWSNTNAVLRTVAEWNLTNHTVEYFR